MLPLINLLRKVKLIQNLEFLDHVTYNMSFFLTYYEIELVKVRLPNNTQVTAKCVGTILLSEDFIIYNVLFIPYVALNILSVQKLSTSLNYKFVFFRDEFQIQKVVTFKMIGRARLGAGLYNLDLSSEKNIALFTQIDDPFQHVKNLDT